MAFFSKTLLVSRLHAAEAHSLNLDVAAQHASVALVLRPRGLEDWDILFIKRAAHELDPWSGHMAFPGGRVEHGDANPQEAAERETLEEIGLDLTLEGQFVSRLDELQAMARGRPLPLVIHPYVYVLQNAPILKPNHEVDALVWVPLSWLLRGEGQGKFPYQWEGQHLELPCVRFGGYLIWGLTHRMLTDFLERLSG